MNGKESIENKIDRLNWKEIDVKSLQIVKEQGELLLKETSETSKIQISRVLAIFKITLPLLVIMIGYLTSTPPSLDIFWTEALLALTFIVILIPMIFIGYRISAANVPGHYPSELLNQEYIDYANNLLHQYTLYNLCAVIENKILENKLRNYRRARIIKKIESTIAIGLIALVTYPLAWHFLSWITT